MAPDRPGEPLDPDLPDPAYLDRFAWHPEPEAIAHDGDGWLSTTRLRGATWLRAGIVNYLTTEADIDRLLTTLRRLAAAPPESAAAGQS